jgi:hypothetical protein
VLTFLCDYGRLSPKQRRIQVRESSISVKVKLSVDFFSGIYTVPVYFNPVPSQPDPVYSVLTINQPMDSNALSLLTLMKNSPFPENHMVSQGNPVPSWVDGHQKYCIDHLAEMVAIPRYSVIF